MTTEETMTETQDNQELSNAAAQQQQQDKKASNNNKKPQSKSQRRKQKNPTPKHSQAVYAMTVQLHSRQAQNVFEHHFESAAYYLYHMSVVFSTMADGDSVDKLGRVLDMEIQKVRDEIEDEIARSREEAEQYGIDVSAIEYTTPREYRAEINTPKTSQYLGLIRGIDQLIGMLDVLWLSGAITDNGYNTRCYQWQRKLSKLRNRFRGISQRAMAAARRRMGQEGRNASVSDIFNDDGTLDFTTPLGQLDAQRKQKMNGSGESDSSDGQSNVDETESQDSD